MPDIADLAEAREAKQRADAIEMITRRKQEPPLVDTDGNRICRDCECLIPPARCAAAPHAVRCIDCQRQMEGWHA